MAKTESTRTPDIKATIVGTVLQLVFSDGGNLTLDANACTDEIRTHAMMHGFKQKLVDAAAISRNPDTGRTASILDKRAAVREVFERLTLAGEWNKTREGGGGSGGLLYRALCRLYEATRTPEQVRAFLDSKTDAEQAALRKSSKIAAMIETIRAESAKDEGIDPDELLQGL